MLVERDPHGIMDVVHDFFTKARSPYINRLYLVRNGKDGTRWMLHLPLPDEYSYTTIAGEGTPEQFKDYIAKEMIRRNYPARSLYFVLRSGNAINKSGVNVYSEDPDDFLSRPKDIYLRYAQN